MAYRRKYKTSKRKTKKYHKRTYTKKRRGADSLTKKIQHVINKNLEDKYAYYTSTNVSYNSGINAPGDINVIIPAMSIGTNDNNRIGDEVSLKSIKIKGYILANMTFNSYSQSRIAVRIMVVQPRDYVNTSQVISAYAVWLPYLLKRGSTTVAFTGLVQDLYTPINNDAIIKYYDRVMYMRTPYIAGVNQGDLNTSGSTRFFTIDLKHHRKKLRYDLNIDSGTTPTNWAPVLLIGYCHLDNASPDTTTTELQLNYDVSMYYQDG